ncbi:MAG TPA: response regulator, partial [Phenylobacterium sp.]|nr:response regulator [Phenylobacterium sp.]
MSLLARLAPHLPYVRRYARALTGDQTTGDHYVRVALEALAAGDRVLEANLSPRVALYHVFHTIWGSTGAQLEPAPDVAPGQGPDDAGRRLMRIAPRSRQAFLLTALEGFTPSETAQILGTDFPEVEALISEAQAEIDAELATDVL